MTAKLKKLAITSLENVHHTDTKTINGVLAAINEPLVRANVEKWCGLKGLPPKAVDYLTNKILRSGLDINEKLELATLLGEDKKLLDFTKMIKASNNRAVSPSQYYNYPKYANMLMAATKMDNDKQILGAPTNIGKGEIAFIVTGGLHKPRQGDLEDGPNVIELKEPTANLGPKGLSHPNKSIKLMRMYMEKKGMGPLPKADTSVGRGQGPEDALSKLLEIKYMNGKGEFPLGDWAKKNGIPLKDVKDVVDEYHRHVYPFTFKASNYINGNYGFDFNKYGRESFAAQYAEYQKQSSFKTLMVFDVKSEKVYTIASANDAKQLWDQVGMVYFSGGDRHGLEVSYGGKIHATKFKNLF